MIQSEEHEENLMKIARKMIRAPQSCPVDEDGNPTRTYLEYLSLMYDPEVAKIVHHLEPLPKMLSITKFAKKLNLDKKEIIQKLEGVRKKGFVFGLGRQYCLPNPVLIWDAPFIFSINAKEPDIKKFAELSRKSYLEEKYYKRWQNSWRGTPYMRVLTVEEEIEPGHEIQPVEEIYSLIDNNSSFALLECPCRLRAEIEGNRECKGKYPIHNCISVGASAEGLLAIGDPAPKPITREEVKEIVKKSVDVGLVLTTDNSAKISNLICSCCECCCGMLRGLTKLDNPRAIAKANFIASVDKEACVACGTCAEERCKFGAIVINDIAEINEDRCMGCGLCAAKCPNDAIKMQRLEREKIPGLAKI